MPGDFGVTLTQLLGLGLIQGQRWLERKARLRPIMAGLLRLGAKRTAPQAPSMHVLNPLAIRDIALAPRRLLEVARIDQLHLEAARLEKLGDGDPKDADRFHRHGLNPTGG